MKRFRLGLAALVILLIYAATRTTTGLFFGLTLLWLFGPGYLLERWLRPPSQERPGLVRLALWVGLSLAIVPWVYLWVTADGLRLTAPALWVATGLLVAGVGWYGWHDLPRAWPTKPRWPVWGPWLAFFAVLGLTAQTRWHHIAGLVFPPWVDSVHHALIIRVIAESGQVPYSLRPYLPIDRFAYHWGYHAVAATIWRLTDLSLPQFMLWFGQCLGTLQVVTLAGTAMALWRRPLAGVVAGIVVGVLSLMPAYYLSWGRYTLLTGLLILPPVMIAVWEWLRIGGWRSALMVVILFVGLSLTHFVVFAFGLLWCVAAWLVVPLPGRRWRVLAVGTGLLLVVGILTAPWIALLVTQTRSAGTQDTGSNPLGVIGGSYNSMPYELLWVGNNRALVVASCLAAGLGLRRRWRGTLAVLVWSLCVMVCANPVWLGLPYLSFFANRIVAIAIFVPLSLLTGSGVAALDDAVRAAADHLATLWTARQMRAANTPPVSTATAEAGQLLADREQTGHMAADELAPADVTTLSAFRSVPTAPSETAGVTTPSAVMTAPVRLSESEAHVDVLAWHRFTNVWNIGLVVALIVYAGWSARGFQAIVNPITIIGQSHDVPALAWIAANTPADARFVINTSGWLFDVPKGSDGGWWILPVTGRQTSTPPSIFPYGSHEYIAATHRVTDWLLNTKDPSADDLAAWMRTEGFNYAYATKDGSVCRIDRLRDAPAFDEVWSGGDVAIFKLRS